MKKSFLIVLLVSPLVLRSNLDFDEGFSEPNIFEEIEVFDDSSSTKKRNNPVAQNGGAKKTSFGQSISSGVEKELKDIKKQLKQDMDKEIIRIKREILALVLGFIRKEMPKMIMQALKSSTQSVWNKTKQGLNWVTGRSNGVQQEEVAVIEDEGTGDDFVDEEFFIRQ